MPYANVGELRDELATHFDETDVANYSIPASRARRIGHFIQRAYEDIWGYRPWNFKYALKTDLTFSSGKAVAPTNMANVGEGGLLWFPGDNSREPWVEVHIQDMVALRAAGRDRHKRWFAVGLLDQSTSETDQTIRQIWIPKDDASYGPFSLFFEMNPRQLDYGDLGNEDMPLPEIFHNVLFLGSAAKMQQAKGDPQSIWRAEYVASVAKVAATYHVNSSRMQQLPQTVGGQW